MRKLFSLVLLAVLISGCSAPGTGAASTSDVNAVMTEAASTAFAKLTSIATAVTPTPSITPTMPDTPTSAPTLTPTMMPTIEPMDGVMTANTNVRSRPSKGASERLGGLFYNNGVKVIGRNDQANWLWIIFSDSPTGTGWITANAVSLKGDMGQLPIALVPDNSDTPQLLPPLIYVITGTPLPLNTPAAGAQTAKVTNLTNVRVGPSEGFMVIGTLQTDDIVTMIGHYGAGKQNWVQIDYPSGPDGHAWISTETLAGASSFSGLPEFNVLGTPATEAPTQGPTDTPNPNATPVPTDTFTPAPAGPAAQVLAQINVRSGPAQSFDSLGMLNPQDNVVVTAQTLNGYWYQIQYANSPNGHGWVASQYIRILGDMRNLPYFDNQGNPLNQP